MKIDPKCISLIENHQISYPLGFAKQVCPIMIEADYLDGAWRNQTLTPFRALSLLPTAKVLHYSQEIFEGLKAYYVDQQGPYLFRPYENAKRFNLSARRMAMPEIDVNFFVQAVEILVNHCSKFIPQKTGESLYIRPFMFASDENLGIDISSTYKFLIIAAPSGSYFTTDGISVFVETQYHRSSNGGTGAAKTGGNYAGSLFSTLRAKERGCAQVLWLNSTNNKYVEELSGMNFFAIIDGKLTTPKTSENILDGVTRKSILQMANDLGLETQEMDIDINDLLDSVESGNCTECFASGTAAIITPILEFKTLNNKSYKLKSNDVGLKIKSHLLSIQEGRIIDKYNWRHPVV